MMAKERKRDPCDIYIGSMLRFWRLKKNRTQKDMARAIGVTFQQIQKYETARTRVSAANLLRLSIALDISVLAFLPDNPDDLGELKRALRENEFKY